MKRMDKHFDGAMSGDSQLNRQLDQALGPVKIPAGMTQRIVARTQPHLPDQRSILARVGRSPMRLAAAIAIILGLGAAFYGHPGEAVSSVGQPSLAQISEQLNQLATIDQPQPTSVDRQIDQLRAQLAAVQSRDALDNAQDDAIAQPVILPLVNSRPGTITY